MDRLVADGALRNALGAAGREEVRQHALPSVVSRLEELYGRVLAERAGDRG